MRSCDRCGAPLNFGDGFCMSCGAPQSSISDDGGRYYVSDRSLGALQSDSSEAPPANPGFFKRLFRRREKIPAETPVQTQAPPSVVQGSVCPRCGGERNSPTDRFCSFCGFCFPLHNGGQPEEDETVVFDDGFADEEESTTMLDEEPYRYFVRDATGERIALNHLPALVGKGSAASCCITGNSGISRVHAEIFVKQDVLMIKDCGSTNGTFVNGERLNPNREIRLQDGDAVLLANEAFTFHVESM